MTVSAPTGRLYGIGLGPGDPELLTVKAVRLIQAAPVVGYFAKAGRRGNARGIVDRWMTGNAEELPLHYPMTTEHASRHLTCATATSKEFLRFNFTTTAQIMV